MIYTDKYISENKTEHNLNLPHSPDKPYRILMIGGTKSGKTNLLLNLIENQTDMIKYIFVY